MSPFMFQNIYITQYVTIHVSEHLHTQYVTFPIHSSYNIVFNQNLTDLKTVYYYGVFKDLDKLLGSHNACCLLVEMVVGGPEFVWTAMLMLWPTLRLHMGLGWFPSSTPLGVMPNEEMQMASLVIGHFSHLIPFNNIR